MSFTSGSFGVGWTALGTLALKTPPRELQDAEARPLPLVEVWYPAADAAVATPCSRLVRVAGWRNVAWWRKTNAVRDSPVAQGTGKFPVLIYNSGWPGTSIENYRLIETLASHGYVVAALTYMSPKRYLQAPVDFSSAAAYRRSVVQVPRRVRIRAADSIAVFDELTRRASAGDALPFVQRIDTQRFGLFGFSLGGAVSAEAACLDARIQAVVNMDGRHWGTALETGVKQPYLFIGEKLQQPSAADLVSVNCDRRYNAILDRYDYSQLARNLLRNGGTQVVIEGTEHMHFTDSALRLRLQRRAEIGRVDARRALDMQNAYIVDFFGQTLYDRPATILGPECKAPHGSVVEHWPRPQRRPQTQQPGA